MSYLENLTPEQRAILLKPSRGLLALRAFAAEYRRQHPQATGNEVQLAYQLAQNAKLRAA